MTFGTLLREWRTRHKLYQKTAASILGVELQTYRGWEYETSEPSARVIIEKFLEQYDREHPETEGGKI